MGGGPAQGSERRPPPAVEAVALTKRFGVFVAVDGVTFSVERGSIFGFLGPNGAGKTTTMRILLGLLEPTSGVARILGLDVTRQTREARMRMGYMSQRFSLYDDLTVEENLSFAGRTYGIRGERLKRRRKAVLETTGLAGQERTLARNLAGGWKQRLALGAAIIHEPAILFLDEPTAGVDPISRRAFWDLLYALALTGSTILVTTHYMDEAEHCQRLAFVQRGQLVAQGSPAFLKEVAMQGQVLEIDCSDPGAALAALRAWSAFHEVTLYGAQIHAVAPNAVALAGETRRLLEEAGIQVRAMEQIVPSLEDVFVSSLRAPRPGAGERNGDWP